MPPRYSEAAARDAVASSLSYAEALRQLGMCHTGNAHLILKKYIELWGIPTDHFDPYGRQREAQTGRGRPLEELLVAGRFVKRAPLKRRLYREGLKQPACELCGQGEEWRGRRMSLILDHVNGDALDNRLENLRIVCPNCNATLDTHCGRNARAPERQCVGCGASYAPSWGRQRFCSRACGWRHRDTGPRPGARKVERPSFEQLKEDVEELGWSGTGRKYGVSDNAVRKWATAYLRLPPG